MDTPMEKRGPGRPRKDLVEPEVHFDPNSINLIRGDSLKFNENIFIPIKTESELDIILSTEGGIMPGTNIIFSGGPGSGKSTLALDMLSNCTRQGYKCLFVSAEMDEIAYYKYCKRIPKFSNVQVLFLKQHMLTVKETLEYVFDLGYDIIAVDSIAEVIDMYKDKYKTTESKAEFWFLTLQDKHKKGNNPYKYCTTFINIQQVTKQGDFIGSNKLKHLTDGMAHVEKSKDGVERSIYFSKNRDCDKDFKVYFTIKDGIYYSYENEKETV